MPPEMHATCHVKPSAKRDSGPEHSEMHQVVTWRVRREPRPRLRDRTDSPTTRRPLFLGNTRRGRRLGLHDGPRRLRVALPSSREEGPFLQGIAAGRWSANHCKHDTKSGTRPLQREPLHHRILAILAGGPEEEQYPPHRGTEEVCRAGLRFNLGRSSPFDTEDVVLVDKEGYGLSGVEMLGGGWLRILGSQVRLTRNPDGLHIWIAGWRPILFLIRSSEVEDCPGWRGGQRDCPGRWSGWTQLGNPRALRWRG